MPLYFLPLPTVMQPMAYEELCQRKMEKKISYLLFFFPSHPLEKNTSASSDVNTHFCLKLQTDKY